MKGNAPSMKPATFAPSTRRQFLALSITGLALAAAGCSKTGTASAVATADAGTAIEGNTSLFGTQVPHELSLSWKEEDYNTMIDAYGTDSSKEWISADMNIDGLSIQNIGVRLKGNSTLRSLGGGGQSGGMGGGMPGMGGGNNGGPPDDARPTDMPEGAGQGMPMGGTEGISADIPESLPLLIRFDKFVKGTKYQGLTQLALRPGSPVLNEALALSLTAASGQESQRYAYTTYSVNGSATQTRLLLENPAEDYAEALDGGNSVLYKADAESSFTYQGAEQATYEDQFKQLNKTDSQDLSPVIDFLKWIDDADDATFVAELAEWVDVDSLARYAATSNLLANSDDMSGPGQNYYLSYNLETRLISVISWDLNMTLASNATAGPDESLSVGGMGGGRGGNSLKSRFLASAAFQKLYDSAYRDLYAQLYSSGEALKLLEQITAIVPASDALTSADIAENAATLKAFVQQRSDALETALAS